MQLEHRVNRVAGRRGDAKLAAERAHFAGEPVEFEAITALEIVRHGCLHSGLNFVHDEIHAIVEIAGVERDALRPADGEGLLHQRAEKAAQLGIGDADVDVYGYVQNLHSPRGRFAYGRATYRF